MRNEKYKGDALLQKTYTVDFLTKKTKKNEGELPQVYVENAHDAIIDKKAFDLVQIETERRKGIKHIAGLVYSLVRYIVANAVRSLVERYGIVMTNIEM